MRAGPDQVPEAAGQVPGSAQVAERELGAGHEQFFLPGPGHAVASVLPGQQAAVLEQVQPVQRGEPAAAGPARQVAGVPQNTDSRWCSADPPARTARATARMARRSFIQSGSAG